MEDEDLWSHQRTARFLGVKPETLYLWIKDGSGPPSIKVGSFRRYQGAAVRAWVQAKTEAGATS